MSLDDQHVHNFSICQLIREFDLIEDLLADCGLWDVDKLSYDIYVKEIKRAYKKEFGSKKWLSYDDEQQLVERVKDGDANAVSQLILANLGLVIHEARKFQNFGLSLNDLISEGNFGLFNAANKVENRGFRFATYAKWHIRSSIMSAIIKYGMIISYPSSIQSEYHKIQKLKTKYYLEYGCTPSDREIAEILKISESKVIEITSTVQSKVSFDAFFHLCSDRSNVLFNDDTIELQKSYMDVYAHQIDDVLFDKSLSIDIEDMLESLHEREREILKKFYGIGCKEMDLEEIGENFDLTRERVRQIKEKAIRRLKGQKSSVLKQYLG